MKRLFILLLMGLVLALTACGQSSATDSASAPAAEAVPQPAETESDTQPETAVDNDNEPITQYPVASTIAEAAVVRETDWTKGAEDPLVTIIEYGDFQ